MEDTTGFFIYDQLAFAPLRSLGWIAEEVAWNEDDVTWSDFEAVVIRSPWDYQDRPSAFFQTLLTIEASGARLLNPSRVCRWNLEKTYLRELADRGVPVIPSRWPDRLDVAVIRESFREFGGTTLVVKPLIGANADDTFVLAESVGVDGWSQALCVFAEQPLIVQPFVESISSVGEFSLFYFGGQYSHAIRKLPRQGDFRVQEEHGGQIQAIVPTDDLVEAAQLALDAMGETLLYARVDLVRLSDGTPALIELELIEPSLYFGFDPDSPRRFAEAFDRMMSSQLR